MPFVDRFPIARDAGLTLPDGPVGVWGATPDSDLSDIKGAVIVSRDARVHDRFAQIVEIAPELAAAVVLVPREKKRAHGFLAEAAAACDGPLIVDGAKTDGIESLYKALKAHSSHGPVAKAHGKLFWLDVPPDLSHWLPKAAIVDGLKTMPGVFSADSVDAGSALLAAALPEKLGKSIVDLGAGWGWLSAQIVGNGRDVHMVETDGIALDCARENVPTATAHWADVTRWRTPMLFDTAIMNPPFHEGRKGVPDLGRTFIAKAAEVLKPSGALYMVANRHLPYESVLGGHFGHVVELPGNNRFKLFHASRPTRRKR